MRSLCVVAIWNANRRILAPAARRMLRPHGRGSRCVWRTQPPRFDHRHHFAPGSAAHAPSAILRPVHARDGRAATLAPQRPDPSGRWAPPPQAKRSLVQTCTVNCTLNPPGAQKMAHVRAIIRNGARNTTRYPYTTYKTLPTRSLFFGTKRSLVRIQSPRLKRAVFRDSPFQ